MGSRKFHSCSPTIYTYSYSTRIVLIFAQTGFPFKSSPETLNFKNFRQVFQDFGPFPVIGCDSESLCWLYENGEQASSESSGTDEILGDLNFFSFLTFFHLPTLDWACLGKRGGQVIFK